MIKRQLNIRAMAVSGHIQQPKQTSIYGTGTLVCSASNCPSCSGCSTHQ